MRKLLSLAFLSIVVLSFTSCKKDDVAPVVETPVVETPVVVTPTPNYVGTWTAYGTPPESSKMTIIYTANTYEGILYLGTIPIVAAKGTVVVAGDLMTQTRTESGSLDDKTGNIIYVKDPLAATTAKFSIVDNKLSVMTDDNKDKVYGGTGDKPTTVYTKQ